MLFDVFGQLIFVDVEGGSGRRDDSIGEEDWVVRDAGWC